MTVSLSVRGVLQPCLQAVELDSGVQEQHPSPFDEVRQNALFALLDKMLADLEDRCLAS